MDVEMQPAGTNMAGCLPITKTHLAIEFVSTF